MKTRNKIEILGCLGADPDLNYTAGGRPVARLRVATDRRPDRNGEIISDWHAVTCWNKLAEAANKYLAKGNRVLIDGRLNYSMWKDKDGKQRKTAEIIAEELTFLGGPNG